jgi:cation:H+ antiporter
VGLAAIHSQRRVDRPRGHPTGEIRNIIAVRTRLGGMFVGVLLMAGATSLPEVLTAISSINQGVPNLAAGNLFGSNMFNMFLLAVLDLVHRKERLLRKAALKHALSGSLTVFLIGLVVF